ncbi:MAG: AMP-binding protein [Streptosporangiales bacterium]|nr:AMP-binding protein [Streptosporangiales bacterium]
MTETFSRLAESGTAYSSEWYEWRDPEIPAQLSPTWYLLDKHLETDRADKAALVADGVPYTYRELAALVERVTAGLAELGVAPGCRLLMVGTDSVEYVALWLACVRAGVIPVVVSDQVKPGQLAYYLLDVEPAVLYVDAAHLTKLGEAVGEVGHAPPTVVVRGDATAAGSELAAARVEPMQRLTDCAAQPPAPVSLHANDIAYMLYSGSTTGPAKGVTHLAHDFLLVPERQGAYWEYTESDVVHATSKKFFTHGLWPGVLIPLYWGSTAVVSSDVPSGESVVEIVEKHRPTKLITVPTTVKAILRYADESGRRPDFSSVGLVVTASEQVPTEIAVRFDELFGLELMDSIGSSEVTYEWIANRQRDYRRGTLGRPVFGYEIKLVGADGDEVTEAGVEGEAWVRSNTACLFYWRKFDASRNTFVGPWTRTGDMLKLTEDGYFQFVGRRDDLFKVSGMWVSPLEVEGAIATSPVVHEVAVVGAPDDNGLTKPVAFVVLRGGEDPTDELADDLRTRVRKVGGYKVPSVVRFVDALPRTPLMKINRRALRELDS